MKSTTYRICYALKFVISPCSPSITVLLQKQNRNETDDFVRATGCWSDAVCMLRDWPRARLTAITIVPKEILQISVRVCA